MTLAPRAADVIIFKSVYFDDNEERICLSVLTKKLPSWLKTRLTLPSKWQAGTRKKTWCTEAAELGREMCGVWEAEWFTQLFSFIKCTPP